MYWGVTISGLLHAALLIWAVINIQSTPDLSIPAPPMIETTIITASELTRLKKGDPTAKRLEAKATDNPQPQLSKQEAEKAKPVTAPPPPAAEPPPEPPAEAKSEPPPPQTAPPPEPKMAALPPEPAPGPTPEELKRVEDEKRAEEQKKEDDLKKAEEEKKEDERKKAEEKKKADDKKKADEKKKKLADKKKADEAKKAADAKKKFDADRISALLDKTPDKRGAPKSGTSDETDYEGPSAGEREGNDVVLSAREQDLLLGRIQAQLSGCWKLPGGGGGSDLAGGVLIRWRLNRDGTLDGEPVVVTPQSDPVFMIAAESGIRAVKQCAPFDLPPETYSAWRLITWDFSPRNMMQ